MGFLPLFGFAIHGQARKVSHVCSPPFFWVKADEIFRRGHVPPVSQDTNTLFRSFSDSVRGNSDKKGDTICVVQCHLLTLPRHASPLGLPENGPCTMCAATLRLTPTALDCLLVVSLCAWMHRS